MSANPNTTNATVDPPTPPENFKNIIIDFISSFLTAFPEYADGVHAFINSASHAQDDVTPDAVAKLFAHCQSVYPERFFDILYQNENIFSPDAAVSNDVSVDFLPGVDFRIVWNLTDISETTKERIWKHLQLITFTIVSGMSQGNVSFGDTAKMFEAINEEELRVKLEETMANLQSMFEDTKNGDNTNNNTNNNNNNNNTNSTNAPDGGSRSGTGDKSTPLPDAEKMHEHLSGLLDGKIGALAKEIAEETVKELDIDVSEETSVSGVFQKLMKNPGKLAGIVKKVGEKLDKKMKSGDIKESELFKEASDFMSKMKGSGGGGKGGMGDIAQLLKSMNLNMGDLGGLGGGGGGGKAKVNLGAMQSQLGRNLKMAQNKERMQKKLEEHRAAAAAAAAAQQPKQMKHSVYQPATSDRNEKTLRVPPGAGAGAGAATLTASCETTPTPPTAPVNQSLETVNDAPEKKKKHKNKNKK
jgi:hypothetical protein